MKNDVKSNKNFNINSTLKYFNFDGFNQDKIIEKYEESLCQREKQIRDIEHEIELINQKLKLVKCFFYF